MATGFVPRAEELGGLSIHLGLKKKLASSTEFFYIYLKFKWLGHKCRLRF
jgi:hypothetical protein